VKSPFGSYRQVPKYLTYGNETVPAKGILVTVVIEVTGQALWCPEFLQAYLVTESGKRFGLVGFSQLPIDLEATEGMEEAVLSLDLTMSACVGLGESTGGHLLFVVPKDEALAKLVIYICSAEVVVDLT